MNPASDSCSFLLAPAPCLSPSSTCRVPPASSDMMAGSDTHPAVYVCVFCSVSLHLRTAGPFVKLKLPDDQSAHDFIKTDCLGPPLALPPDSHVCSSRGDQTLGSQISAIIHRRPSNLIRLIRIVEVPGRDDRVTNYGHLPCVEVFRKLM